MAKEPSEKLRAEWVAEIRKSGVKRLKVRTLLKAFGAERRGAVTVARIDDWCRAHGLHANGLKNSADLDSVVSLSDVEIKRIGDLAPKEKDLTDRFEREIAPELGGLTEVKPNFSPAGSRDAFDFLCRDPQGRVVVVEIKRADGERRAVEQVLRYLQHLRKDPDYAKSELRGIIVTGEGDIATWRALEELPPDCAVEWYVYGIVEGNRIKLERQDVRSRGMGW